MTITFFICLAKDRNLSFNLQTVNNLQGITWFFWTREFLKFSLESFRWSVHFLNQFAWNIKKRNRFITFVPLKKIFHILFSIYFIALVVVPCSDKDDCDEVNSTQVSQTTHHEDRSNEVCSPFCVCSCCAAHFLVKEFRPTLNQIAIISTVYTIHKESKTSAAITSIWQPPKIA